MSKNNIALSKHYFPDECIVLLNTWLLLVLMGFYQEVFMTSLQVIDAKYQKMILLRGWVWVCVCADSWIYEKPGRYRKV